MPRLTIEKKEKNWTSNVSLHVVISNACNPMLSNFYSKFSLVVKTISFFFFQIPPFEWSLNSLTETWHKLNDRNIFARSTEWGGDRGGSYYNQTTLSEDPNYKGSDSTNDIMQIIGEVFNKSKVPITFLNITQLSSYRKDAHINLQEAVEPAVPRTISKPY